MTERENATILVCDYYLFAIYYLLSGEGKLYREKYGTLFRGRPLSRGTSCDSCHETKWQDSDECDWRGESAGGYVLYANHQGKYDALGIMDAHKKPCTVMMDAKRSKMIIVDQFITLIDGCRIDKTDIKSQVEATRKVTKEVKKGRRYIVFPEGGYFHNRNAIKEFMPGAFKCAVRANCPIVPVLLVDSYKPFEINSLRRVKTQVHFLPAIYPEEYEGLTTDQIAKLVRNRIVDAMQQKACA